MSSLRPPRASSPRFMPFPGLSGQRGSSLQNQGGYARSPSGSETDSVSTSTENLSHEERYAIRHTPRQDPQGQENIGPGMAGSHCNAVGGSNSHSPICTSSCHRVPNIRDVEESNLVSYHHSKTGSSAYHQGKTSSPRSSPHCGGGHNADGEKKQSGNTGREITEIPVDYLDQSQVLKHLAKEVTKPGRKSLDLSLSSPSSSSSASSSLSSSASSPVGPYPSTPQKGGSQGQGGGGQQRKGGSPSVGSGGRGKSRRGSSSGDLPFHGRLHTSCSQPDLSRIANVAGRTRDAAILKGIATNPRPRTKARDMLEWRLGLVTSNSGSSRKTGSPIWPQLEMIEILAQENSELKLELEACFQKVAKSQKLEQEVSKVHRSHQELIESTDRRERLERAARMRLQEDIRRLQEMNRSLSSKLSMLMAGGAGGQGGGNDQASSASVSLEVSSLRKELAERDLLLAQLVTSNKELAACKERQEIELAAQRATLQEQRTHIDILDTALTNAQGNVVRLEEENRKKQMYVERVGQLQRALSSLQLASDHREQTERKLRTQLEREILELREREGNKGGAESLLLGGVDGDGMRGGDGDKKDEEEVRELRRQLRDREERILAVEAELAKLERRCIQEGALMQAAIDAASIPKDAKIAALERTSQESERLVAEARSEKMRHMDEVHAAQRKVADLEARVKDLESRLAERDAMIRVLQKHTYEKEVVFLSSPHHTPHASALHGSSFHSGGGLHSTTLHGNSLHGNSSSLHSNSLHGNSYHGSSLHSSGLHGSSYHDSSSVYRAAAADILATTREELGSVSTASVFSAVNSIGGGCDSSGGGNVGNLGGICSPGAGSGVGIGSSASGLRSVQYGSPPLNSGGTSSVGGEAFGGGGGSGVGASASSREGPSSSTIINCSFDDAKKSLDDQLKELDSQLLSKRALCCFPGLTNPGSQARKGAVPKPLLAGVAAPSRSLPPHLLFGGGEGTDTSSGTQGRGGDDGNGPDGSSGRLGARMNAAQAYLPPNMVLKGMGRYGAIGGPGGSTGSGRSGSPSLVGFVPNLLKGGSGSQRYGGMGGGDGSNSSTTTGGGAGSEEIQLLEKQGVSSQRMRKAEGEEVGSDGGKKGRKVSIGGVGTTSSSCQKGTSGGGNGMGAGKGSLSSLVPHLPPRTGIPMPSPRRPRKTESSGTSQSGGGGHRRRMVGAGGVVVGARGYGRLNEEDAVSKGGEGEGEVEHSRRRSSSTSSVPGGSSKMPPMTPISPPPSRTPPTRSSQVVSKIRLFQGNGIPVGGGGSRSGIPIGGGKSSPGNTSPLLRERLGGGKYRIQL
ncbi:uncharacterized protein LOC124163899 isoform X2 [Ischnura elegans]|uniref:uncharacterized protein LOC124163899 isoform X2 n=1 Tax=Ischnura elegans TaxID=197161 RepID=UPI001ED8BAFD|nr:uncharacterized protein LOC124163899 isoform X2 [Ischnura elegans]